MADVESTTIPRELGTQKPRKLKVGYHYPEPTAASRAGITVPVPYVRLCGRWLQEAGFTIGQRIKVEINDGRLMIGPADL